MALPIKADSAPILWADARFYGQRHIATRVGCYAMAYLFAMLKGVRVPSAVLLASVAGLVVGIIVSLALPAAIHAPSGVLKVIRDGAPQAPAWLTAVASVGSWFFVRWMRVRVVRLEQMDYHDLSDTQFARELAVFNDVYIGCRLVAWVEIETRWANNRATDWNFSVARKDGSRVALTVMDRQWDAPQRWSQGVKYFNLDQIKSMSLERDKVYNACVFLEAPGTLSSELDMTSLRVAFLDAYGRRRTVVDGPH